MFESSIARLPRWLNMHVKSTNQSIGNLQNKASDQLIWYTKWISNTCWHNWSSIQQTLYFHFSIPLQCVFTRSLLLLLMEDSTCGIFQPFFHIRLSYASAFSLHMFHSKSIHCINNKTTNWYPCWAWGSSVSTRRPPIADVMWSKRVPCVINKVNCWCPHMQQQKSL